MVSKSTLFMLVFALVATRMGSTVEGYAQAPVNAPAKAPIYAPTTPALPWGYGTACVAMCVVHCKPAPSRRACMKTCTACCKKSYCVPEFSKCCYWDTVTIRGKIEKCP